MRDDPHACKQGHAGTARPHDVTAPARVPADSRHVGTETTRARSDGTRARAARAARDRGSVSQHGWDEGPRTLRCRVIRTCCGSPRPRELGGTLRRQGLGPRQGKPESRFFPSSRSGDRREEGAPEAAESCPARPQLACPALSCPPHTGRRRTPRTGRSLGRSPDRPHQLEVVSYLGRRLPAPFPGP